MKTAMLLVLIALILVSGCVSEEAGLDDNRTPDEQPMGNPPGDGVGGVKETVDPCGDIYYDYEIVSGPDVDAFQEDRDNPFRSLTVHPTDPDVLLIGTERNGFIKTSDGGRSWIRIREGLRPQMAGYSEIYDIGWSVSNPDVIYAVLTDGPCPPGEGYPCSGAGVFKSVDRGLTWKPKNCGLPNLATLELVVDPSDEDHVFVSIQPGTPTFTLLGFTNEYLEGGLYETVDGGEVWNKVGIGENDHKNSYAIRSAGGGLIYAFGISDRQFDTTEENIGFIKSTDFGRTWKQLAPDLREERVSSFDVSGDGNSLYTVSREGRFRESHDSGESWSHKDTGSGAIYSIAVSPADKDRILFGMGPDVHLSTDGLDSYNRVIAIEPVGDKHVSDIVFSPSDPDIVYAIFTGAYPDNPGYDLYKSMDAGNSFSKIANLREDVLRVMP
jgi:photosystem II stability/assembly factor-like uncharacterized protein